MIERREINVRAAGSAGADILEGKNVFTIPRSGNEVRSDLPDTVFSDATPVADFAGGLTQWALLHFDDPSSLTGEALAVLITNEVFTTSTGSPHSTLVTATVKLWLMTVDWNPATVTWNTRPTPTGDFFTHTQTLTNQVIDINGSGEAGGVAIIALPFGSTVYGLLTEISSASPTPDATNDLIYEGTGDAFRLTPA
jgi:hypothetical protein